MRNRGDWLRIHFYTARKLASAKKKLRLVAYEKGIKYAHQRKILSAIRDLMSPQSALDDHYHELITDEEFNDWGHIYYHPDGKPVSRKKSHKQKA